MPADDRALVGLLAMIAAAAVWWRSRRSAAASEIALKAALRARPKREPPQPAEALARVVNDLKTAARLLEEVSNIGLWVKSDDSSDNRRRRQALRETDWAASGALRALAELRQHQPDLPAPLLALEDELRALVALLEPLPHTVTDTMGESPPFDVDVTRAAREVDRVLERALAVDGAHRTDGTK